MQTMNMKQGASHVLALEKDDTRFTWSERAYLMAMGITTVSGKELRQYVESAHRQAHSTPVEITIYIAQPLSDYPVILQIWQNILSSKRKSATTLQVHRYSKFPPAVRICRNAVLNFNRLPDLAMQNKLSAVSNFLTGKPYALLTPTAPLYWPDHLQFAIFSTEPSRVLFLLLSLVNVGSDSQFVVYENENSIMPLRESIDRDFFKVIFSSHIPAVIGCNDFLECSPLRLWKNSPDSIRTLFIFPQPFIPASRAFLMRGLDLLLGMNYGGEPTAILMHVPSKEKRAQKIQEVLSIFSPSVTISSFPANPKHSLHIRIPLWLEKKMRARRRLPGTAPLRFSMRCSAIDKESFGRILEKTAQGLPALQQIIYTGAYFMPLLRQFKKNRSNIKFYCDTHDVFFVVDKDIDKNEKRFFYRPAYHKRLELAMLRQADGLIAISTSDENTLLEVKANPKIVVASGSFSHCIRGVDTASVPIKMIFGFIGSGNENNRKCLKVIAKEWWPFIVERYPEALLHIAGPICELSEAKLLEKTYPAQVKRLGFVDSLSDFYLSVRAIVSPIVVQGGLNFKSVEALMAGRSLLVNELGARCLGGTQPGVFIIGPKMEGLAEAIDAINDPSQDNGGGSLPLHENILKRFGHENAYTSVLGELLRTGDTDRNI